jgi:membrane protease YdiL (CAAX protease family)
MPESSWTQRLIRHIEAPPSAYGMRGEMALGFAVLPLTFAYQALELLVGRDAGSGHSLTYVLLLSSFTALAFSSVFPLATPAGEGWVRRMLQERRLDLLASLPLLFVGFYLLILWIGGFPELTTDALKRVTDPWSRLPLPVFLAGAAGLLYGGFRGGLSLATRSAAQTQGSLYFGWKQLGCVVLTALPYLVLQEVLPILWCFTTPVSVLVLVYGTGLGREYFGFTFLPRSLKEAGFVVALLILGLVLFLATNAIVGGITYTGGLWSASWLKVYTASFIWLFIVGISEEVIFRCGILTLFAAYLGRSASQRWWTKHPRIGAVLATSLLFGLAHFPHGPVLMFLAFLASLLYGLSFVAGKSLFGPVLLHGMLNVLLLMNFKLLAF